MTDGPHRAGRDRADPDSADPDSADPDSAVPGGPATVQRAAVLRQAISISLSVIPFGLAFGVAAEAADLSLLQAVGFSTLVFTGGSQFAAVSVLADGGTVAAAVIGGLLLNLRSLAFGIVMAPALHGPLWWRAAAAQLMIDETTAVGAGQPTRDGQRFGFLASGLILFTFWNLSTVAGVTLLGGADALIENAGIDATIPAAFLALLWPRLADPRQRRVAITGAVIALALAPVAPAGVPIIAASCAVVIAGRWLRSTEPSRLESLARRTLATRTPIETPAAPAGNAQWERKFTDVTLLAGSDGGEKCVPTFPPKSVPRQEEWPNACSSEKLRPDHHPLEKSQLMTQPSPSFDLAAPSAEAISSLAPTGTLRAAINLSNFLLVTGKGADGNPEGVSPDMARELAAHLAVPIELLRYKTPADLADDAQSNVWDIGNIGAEPQRAAVISFTSAYCEIESTYLVPAGSPITSIGEVDQPGIRIASAARAAYDLWLENNIEHAELVQVSGLDGSFNAFVEQKLDALAGLRPRLITDVERLPGARILDGYFSTVQQAMGTPQGREDAGIDFLVSFVEAAKAAGFVADLIAKHEVKGLSVAGPASGT